MTYNEYTSIIQLAKNKNLNIKILKINLDIKNGKDYNYIINNLQKYI